MLVKYMQMIAGAWLTRALEMHLNPTVRFLNPIRAKGNAQIAGVCLLVLLAVSTVQAAHFCGFGAAASTVRQTSAEDGQEGSNRAVCAVCVSAHQAGVSVAIFVEQPFFLSHTVTAVAPASRIVEGSLFLPDVRPPPVS